MRSKEDYFMNTIAFACKITEVNELVTKFRQVIKAMSNCWEASPAVVMPMGDGVLVSISYRWGYNFPAPQNFDEMFGESPNKKYLRNQYISKMKESWGKEE